MLPSPHPSSPAPSLSSPADPSRSSATPSHSSAAPRRFSSAPFVVADGRSCARGRSRRRTRWCGTRRAPSPSTAASGGTPTLSRSSSAPSPLGRSRCCSLWMSCARGRSGRSPPSPAGCSSGPSPARCSFEIQIHQIFDPTVCTSKQELELDAIFSFLQEILCTSKQLI